MKNIKTQVGIYSAKSTGTCHDTALQWKCEFCGFSMSLKKALELVQLYVLCYQCLLYCIIPKSWWVHFNSWSLNWLSMQVHAEVTGEFQSCN